MHINYKIKGCSHCGNDKIVVLGNENNIYGLVSLESSNNGNTTINVNKVLPVIATVCQDCGHVDLIHIDAKAINASE